MQAQELFETAKELLLKGQGEQSAPLLFVEYINTAGEGVIDILYFAAFGQEDPVEERMDMFDLGVTWGKERGKVDFRCLTFITEAWVSTVLPDEKREWNRPHEDPNRKECLMAQIVEIEPKTMGKPEMHQKIIRAQILRPTPDTIDLLEEKDTITVTSMLLPTYFLAGWSSTRLTEQQKQEVKEKTIEFLKKRS